MPVRDYYEVLGVDRDAPADAIRSAYRRLARELHPDVNKAPDAAKRFTEVQEAYDVLSDEAKRRNYDRFGSPDGPQGFGVGDGTGGGRRGTYTWANVGGRPSGGGGFTDADAGSIFEEIFGGRDPFADAVGSARGPGRTRGRVRPQRGKDVEHEVVIDFMDAVRGATKSLRIARGDSTRTVELTIPRGIEHGTRLRMRGLGGPPSGGGAPPGDLIVTVHVAPHELFRREGLDVLLDLPLTITEAALGARVRVPTLGGRADLTVPPGTPSGQRLRLRGQGISSTATGATGDLYAVVRIVAPKDLSPADQSALRELGSRLPSPREGPMWE
jgi:curved DNA-binding protein